MFDKGQVEYDYDRISENLKEVERLNQLQKESISLLEEELDTVKS